MAGEGPPGPSTEQLWVATDLPEVLGSCTGFPLFSQKNCVLLEDSLHLPVLLFSTL